MVKKTEFELQMDRIKNGEPCDLKKLQELHISHLASKFSEAFKAGDVKVKPIAPEIKRKLRLVD